MKKMTGTVKGVAHADGIARETPKPGRAIKYIYINEKDGAIDASTFANWWKVVE